MSTRVRARRLTHEGQYLQRLVRRGRHDSVRYRRALIIMASASGTGAPAIAQLVAADPDTVRDVIHAFNAQGLAMLAPHWGAGRPRRITDEDIAVVVATAMTRPKKLGLPFTHWSIRKLTAYLGGWYGHHDPTLVPARMIRIGRERVRVILHEHGIGFQRTRTWKTSTDPAYDAKLDRIDEVMSRFRRPGLRVRPVRAVEYPALPRHLLGPPASIRTGRPRPTTARTGSGTSTAVTAWPRTGCGACCTDTRAVDTLSPRSRRSGRPARTGPRSTSSATTCRSTPPRPDPDQRVLGQPDRGAVRTVADVHHGQLRLPQPHHPGPGPARLPALAQRQQPPP